MEISNETSPTGRAKGIFSTFDHISFCLSDLIFPLLDSPVISAHRWITVENVRQPIIPAVLSSAVVCPNSDRGKTSMAETDKTMRKEKEEEEGGGNGPFQNQEIGAHKESEMGHKKQQWPELTFFETVAQIKPDWSFLCSFLRTWNSPTSAATIP